MADELDLVIEKASYVELDTFSRDTNNFYNEDKIRSNREELLLKQTIKDFKKNRTQIYLLKNSVNQEIIGLIGLSGSRLDDKPALLIDYIFIIDKYRKRNSGFSYASVLIAFAFDKGLKLQEEMGLSNLILYPDNEDINLINYYKETYGFMEIRKKISIQNKSKNEKWLYSPLKTK